MIALSVLDQLPIFHGKTSADTLQETIALAQAVESFGYRRFWVAEHHSDAATACASPEILVAAIAANTTRIRVGSGGVMLPHYSALKVAENFRMLHALFPGRIDLGVGRGPGAVPETSRALREIAGIPHNNGSITQESSEYRKQLNDLCGFLTEALPEEHPYKDIRVMPDGFGYPQIWLLGSSPNSSLLAGSLGLPLCFAQFSQTTCMTPHYLDSYRQSFRPSFFLNRPCVSVAVRVICAETEAQAQHLATSFWWVTLNSHDMASPIPHVEQGRARFPSIEDTEGYHFSDRDRDFIRANPFTIIVGDPEQVRAHLTELAEAYGVEELLIVNACPDLQSRIRSYQLVAQALQPWVRES